MMETESTDRLEDILSTEQLEDFQSRVARYDENNEFFHEDFEVLQASGYLIQAVPEELGGLGLSFVEVCRQQRRLAYYAPADALAVNMHIYWTGVAADLWRSGDTSLEWLLREACAGEIFAAGHAENKSGTFFPNHAENKPSTFFPAPFNSDPFLPIFSRSYPKCRNFLHDRLKR